MLGLVGYPSDDINKFLWMVRIGGGVFPHIKEPDYLVNKLINIFLLKYFHFNSYLLNFIIFVVERWSIQN